MHKTKRVFFFAILVPFLALIAATSIYTIRVGRVTMDRLPEVLQAAVNERINGKVSIGDIRLLPGGRIIAKNIVIQDNDKSSQLPVAKIPRITISYRLIDLLLMRKDPVNNIRRIDITRPQFLIERYSDGSLNISHLLKSAPPGAKVQLPGSIHIKSAKLLIRDYKPNAAKPVVNAVTDVNASIRSSDKSAIQYSVSGHGQRGRFERFTCKGSYKPDRHITNADLSFSHADASYLSKYPWNLGANIISGTANINIKLSKYGPGKANPIQYHALAKLDRAAVRFATLQKPIRDVNGDINVRRSLVILNLQGRLGTSPLKISGRLITSKKPYLMLDFTSDKANFKELASFTSFEKQLSVMRLPDSGKLSAYIYGPSGSPSVRFNITAPKLSIGAFQGSLVVADGIYSSGHISIREASAEGLGGRLKFHGDLGLSKNPSINLNGEAFGLNTEAIPSLRENGVKAKSSGNFEIDWKSGNLNIGYRGIVEDMRSGRFQVGRANIDANYENGIFNIKEFSAGVLGGQIAASGEISQNRELKLHIEGSDVNLASIGSMYWKAPTVGRVKFAGDISGNANSPQFKGEVEAQRVMFSGIGVESITGDITVNRAKVDINNAVINKGSGTISLSGNILNPLAKQPRIDLNVKAEAIDMNELSRALNVNVPELSGGMVSAEIAVTGNLRNPSARGEFRTKDGKYKDIPFDIAEASIGYARDGIQLEKLTATSGDSVINLNGSLSNDKHIEAGINGEQLSAELFSKLFEPYAHIVGKFDILGNAGGTMKMPVANMSIKGSDIAVNYQKLDQIAGNISVDKSKLTLSDFKISDKESEYNINTLAFEQPVGITSLDASIKNGDGAKMLAIFDASPKLRTDPQLKLRKTIRRIPRPFSGIVNADVIGSIGMSGGKLNPSLDIKASVDKLNYGSGSIGNIDIEGSWKEGIINLQKMEAVDGDTNFFAQGSIDQEDALDLRLDAHNLSVDSLRQWFEIPKNFSGKADVTIVAGGTMNTPTAEAFVEVVDPVLAGVKMERLRSRLSVEDGTVANTTGKINIDELTLMLDNHYIKASGYVPMDWKEFNIPEDSPISLKTKLGKDSLDLLSAFTGIIFDTAESGVFEGSVNLNGTKRSPYMDGELIWSKGRIQIPGFNSPLEDIDAHIALYGDDVSIKKITGISREGGNLNLGGNISLKNLKPSLDLQLQTNGLRLSGRNITKMYGEDINAQFNGELKVVGDWKTPSISGNMSIPEGSLSLAGKPNNNHRTTEFSFDPRFDIGIMTGRNMQFKSSRLNIPLHGNMNIAGSLSKPIVNGALDISGGTIIFPMRQLKIMSGSTMEFYLEPPNPPSVRMDMRAQTRLAALSPFGRTTRYDVIMALQGPLDNMNPSFSASPPGLSEQQIVGHLTGQSQIEQILAQSNTDFTKEITGLFSTAYAPIVLAPIERALEDSLGFDEFALEMGYREPIQLRIGDRIWDRFYLNYSTVLGSRPDYSDSKYEFELSYRFKHGLELGFTANENKTIGILMEGKMKF